MVMRWMGGPRLVLLAVALAQFTPMPGHAQFQSGPGFAPAQQFAPATGPSSLPSPPPVTGGSPMMRPPRALGAPPGTPLAPATQVSLAVSARLGRDLPQPLSNGLVWRVYPARPDPSKPFKPVKEERTATPVFLLEPGD